MMKRKTIIWIWTFCLGPVFGAMEESPGARSPIGSPTQVPSAAQRRAVAPQPGLYGYVGNLTMTGNIGGGRHFRGFVPYGSMEYLDPRLIDPGTRQVSSFVRRSYGGAQPYFDPGRTVSSMRQPGLSDLSSPVPAPQQRTATASDQWLASFDLSQLLQAPNQRPLNSSARAAEAVVDQQIARDLAKKPLPAIEPVKPIQPGMDLPMPPVTPQIPTPPKPLEPGTIRQERPADQTGEITIYQRIRRELERTSSLKVGGEETDSPDQTPAAKESSRPAVKDPSRSSLVVRPEDVIDPADGRRVLEGYSDYQQLARTKAEDYMAVGERFLKMGQYYKAADAFELSHVWDRNSSLPVLARSHALFAAGEYMSSAYFLGQALENDPNLIQCRIDWGALLDSRDSFEAQLVELSTWQQRSNSAELAFLMGYVLYTDDKLTRAKVSAEYAFDNMPNHAGARILAEAIQKAQNPVSTGTGNM
jgi:hypothetical protein